MSSFPGRIGRRCVGAPSCRCAIVMGRPVRVAPGAGADLRPCGGWSAQEQAADRFGDAWRTQNVSRAFTCDRSRPRALSRPRNGRSVATVGARPSRPGTFTKTEGAFGGFPPKSTLRMVLTDAPPPNSGSAWRAGHTPSPRPGRDPRRAPSDAPRPCRHARSPPADPPTGCPARPLIVIRQPAAPPTGCPPNRLPPNRLPPNRLPPNRLPPQPAAPRDRLPPRPAAPPGGDRPPPPTELAAPGVGPPCRSPIPGPCGREAHRTHGLGGFNLKNWTP